MSDRVDPYVALPVDMDPLLRQELVGVLRKHAIQINWATGQDTIHLTASATVAHDLVLVTAGESTVIVTLPPALIWQDRQMSIKKVDATGTMRIAAQSGETIDKSASGDFTAQGTSIQIMSDGTEWWIVATYNFP